MTDLSKILSQVKPGEMPVVSVLERALIFDAKPKAAPTRALANMMALRAEMDGSISLVDKNDPTATGHIHSVQSDLAEENEDNTDWKALAEERRLEAENERAKASALQTQMDIHVKRIERWEKQFDLINLPRIIDALKNIIDYPTALIALNEFDRDWFIAAQLSEEGKVSFARELLAVIQRFAPGENTNLLEAISTANAATLNGLWKDSTSNEIEE